MPETERDSQIQLMRTTIEDFRHQVNMTVDTMLVQLENLASGETPPAANVTDWDAEVDSWFKP